MPWQGWTLMDQRRSLIEDYLAEAWTMTELCDLYGVSRKTAYKWLARYEATGLLGLGNRSSRPHTHPHAVGEAIATAVCAARRQKPQWGPRKIRSWLVRRQPEVAWPSRVTIAAIWRRAGLLESRRARPVRTERVAGRTAASTPNAVWTVDFKGDFRLGHGTRCYPLTLRDLASRYALRCDALAQPDLGSTQHRINRAFAEFGLPVCIRSDNGPPFAGLGLGGLSQLSLAWMRLGIRVERIAPGHPEQNGSHEQFHRMLKAGTARPPAPSLRAQQRRFDRFCQEYNEERPHEALGDRVPAQYYTPSPRPCPRRLPPCEYPGHWEARRVQPNGCISWTPRPIFLSRALAGQTVALEEVDDGIWTVHFAQTPLARWLAREQRLRPLID